MTEKAIAIPKRHTKTCEVCMAIDSEDNKDLIFHLFEEGYTDPADDKYICSKCLEQIKSIRKMCNLKFENPHHNPFKDFVPWFASEIPGMADAFKDLIPT